MPAAASFEDLYQQATTCSSLSSSYHLPSYMSMFLASADSAAAAAAKQQQPLAECATRASNRQLDRSRTAQSQTSHTVDIKSAAPTTTTTPTATTTTKMVMDTNVSHSSNSSNKLPPSQRLINHHQQQQQYQSKIAPQPTSESSYQCISQNQRRAHQKEDLSRASNKQHYGQRNYQNQYYYYHDDNNDDNDNLNIAPDSDLFNWQPHSYHNDGFDIFDLENVMILHDDLRHCNYQDQDDDDESLPPQFLTTMTPPTMQHYLTLEELKSTRNSCWLCGCNWQQDHVSLDCPECGGYALTRPCPTCDGKCQQVWMRNISNTHDRHKASWLGQCSLNSSNTATTNQQVAQVQRSPATATGCQQQQHTTTAVVAPGESGAIRQGQTTTTTRASSQPVVIMCKAAQTVVQPSSSSCCSSQPSSAASSDSE